MLSRQQRDATHGRTACIAANPAVPQTQPQTCGHVSAVPTCHPVRPATGYGTDKDSIGRCFRTADTVFPLRDDDTPHIPAAYLPAGGAT